jgi:hypothetical protein
MNKATNPSHAGRPLYDCEHLEARYFLNTALFPGTQLAVGPNPHSLVSADFNGDGKIDLAIANFGDSTVSMLFGNGDGTFASSRSFKVGSGLSFLASADVNGDGWPDLIATDTGSGSVDVLLNNCDGTFESPDVYPTGPNPSFITIGDFNRDGHPDIAVAGNSIAGKISVLLSNGDSSFSNAINYPVSLGKSVAVGDFNGDGLDDLAVARGGSAISLLFGNGDGTFKISSLPIITTGSSLSSVVAADFNDDGIIDLAVTDSTKNNLLTLLGTGNATFEADSTIDVGVNPMSLIASDIDDDGKIDLVTVNNAEIGTVSVVVNNGSGNFAAAANLNIGQNPIAIAAADFNSDDVKDLAVANYSNPGSVSICFGRGDGTFPSSQSVPVGVHPHDVVAADFNGDGHMDLAIADFGSNDISISLNDGDGTFKSVESVPVGWTSAIVAGDFNGDGHLDIASANSNGDNSVSILLGNGDGTFIPVESALRTGQSPMSIVTGDFNDDGKLDLATVDADSNDVSIFLGRGDGMFNSVSTIPVGSSSNSVVASDLNQDGHLDLIIANSASDTVSVLLGVGDGTFAGPMDVPVGHYPRAIATGDFNGDGYPDVAVANYFDGNVSLLIGNGDGTFQPAQSTGTNSSPEAVITGDFNGDGLIDLATVDGIGSVAVLLGKGDGTFASPLVFGVGKTPLALLAADFEGDGKLDLATANSTDDSISVLSNQNSVDLMRTSQTVASALTEQIQTSPSQLKIFDGNSFVDISEENPVDRLEGTEILTHGWQSSPNGTINDPEWPKLMASAILAQHPTNPVNILAWDWEQDSDASLPNLSASTTPQEGKGLGDTLIKFLGSDYALPIHFIGHSLGTLVNAAAIDRFQSQDHSGAPIQDTILDDGAAAALIGLKLPESAIPTTPVSWIDNYVSAAGALTPQAANVVLTNSVGDDFPAFHSYAHEWYQQTIEAVGDCAMGFCYDITQPGFDAHPSIGTYFLQDLLIPLLITPTTQTQADNALLAARVVEDVPTVLLIPAYVASKAIPAVIQFAGHVTADLQTVLQQDPYSNLTSFVLTPSFTLEKHSPSYAWIRLNIPKYAASLSFSFVFDDLSPADFLSVGVNDQLQFQMESEFGNTINSGSIDVSQWAGQSITLFLGLNNSDDIAGGSITVSNLNFEIAALPGDANGDGAVNMQDFDALASHYGQTGTSRDTGDFNGDGITNALDLNALATNFGRTLSTISPSVPSNIFNESSISAAEAFSPTLFQPFSNDSVNSLFVSQQSVNYSLVDDSFPGGG